MKTKLYLFENLFGLHFCNVIKPGLYQQTNTEET